MSTLSPVDINDADDLRPVALLVADFQELFGKNVEVEVGLDGFGPYEAAGARHDDEPVMLLRYRTQPPGTLTFYAREALSQSAKLRLLRRIIDAAGLPPDRLVAE